MIRRLRLFAIGLAFAVCFAPSAAAQVVINPAPVPSCSNGQTLIYNSGTWACGSTTGTGTWIGSGTTGKIPKATGAQQLGDSIMAESGTTVTVTGTLNATAALHLNGTSINTAGTLTNVAYTNQANTFTSGVQTFPNDLALSATAIGLRQNTADASDNRYLTITGGGAASVSRGGVIEIYGNESVGLGAIAMYAGQGGGPFEWYGGSTVRSSLSNAGAWRWHAYGAGTLQTDASGNITASSDARLKEDQGVFEAGLAQVLGLRPRLYRWKPETGLDSANTYAGFVAQNVRSFVPEAIGVDRDGRLSVSTTPILAATVTAVHELVAEIDELRAHLKLSPRDRAPREAANPQQRTVRYEITPAAAADRSKEAKKEPPK